MIIVLRAVIKDDKTTCWLDIYNIIIYIKFSYNNHEIK